MVKDSGAFAVANGYRCGRTAVFKNLTPPAGSKSVEDLREVEQAAGLPICQRNHDRQGVDEAKEAADAIVVSNHCGAFWISALPPQALPLGTDCNSVDGSMEVFLLTEKRDLFSCHVILQLFHKKISYRTF